MKLWYLNLALTPNERLKAVLRGDITPAPPPPAELTPKEKAAKRRADAVAAVRRRWADRTAARTAAVIVSEPEIPDPYALAR